MLSCKTRSYKYNLSVKQKTKQSSLSTIINITILNSLIITPFFNKDGMIIPKLMVMFSLSLYLLPILFSYKTRIFSSKTLKLAVVLQLLILLDSLVVMIMSSAPIEQQIFGRTGRGLGLITIFSMAVIFIASAVMFEDSLKHKILFGLILSAFISSFYSILQSYGIDLLKWESKTNGVIGTLGNPNFQSAFAAMVLVPTFIYFSIIHKRFYVALTVFLFFCFTIYRTESTQGYIAGFFSIAIALLIYVWYRSKLLFIPILIAGATSAFFAVTGMLNYGPLSSYLYKVSVQSRGDFWRSAFNTANAHPFFGVGIETFGDYSLKYRDLVIENRSIEYTDNAHNFFLEHAATGGYPFAVLNFTLVILTFSAFLRYQIVVKKFEPVMTSLFSAFIAFQMTSVISPGNLVTMHWNMVISGTIIGLASTIKLSENSKSSFVVTQQRKFRLISIILAFSGFMFVLPLFNTDRIQLIGMKRGDASLVMKATFSFPESTVRYSLIGRELYNSGLLQQSLEVARSGVEFNPNSPSMWALILVNQNATPEERLNAKNKILILDPLNKAVKNFNP